MLVVTRFRTILRSTCGAVMLRRETDPPKIACNDQKQAFQRIYPFLDQWFGVVRPQYG